MQNTTPFLVQYSEKSIAVFGNTFPIKDQLKALKGKYNKHLTYDNTKVSGWIFGSKIKDVIEELIGPIKSGSKEELGIEGPTAPSTEEKKEIIAIREKNAFIENYTEKSIALFGNTIVLKDKLKELNGKYNAHLTYNGHKIPGWIFSNSQREQLEALLEEEGTEKKQDIEEEEEAEVKEEAVAESEPEPEREDRKRKAEEELEQESMLA